MTNPHVIWNETSEIRTISFFHVQNPSDIFIKKKKKNPSDIIYQPTKAKVETHT